MGKEENCSVCGNSGKVFVSFVTGSDVIRDVFCGEHAESEGFFDEAAWGFFESEDSPLAIEREPMRKCPECGFSQRDFERLGRFGCASCFDTFGSALRPLLARMHLGATHMGKIPRKALADRLLQDRICYLEVKMQKAVECERYEEAAEYRDAISEIREMVTQDS